MNKHIELVKKWLADPSSVSLEELQANANAAYAAADAYAGHAYAAVYAAAQDAYAYAAVYADAAAAADAYAADAKYWVKCYEELVETDA